jgi:hypothetical protein
MKFAVDAAHRDFFRAHLAIEFEAFFALELVLQLRQEVYRILTTRLHLPFDKASSLQLFMAGRDLWRASPLLRKLAVQSKLADIAADLTEERAFRLGYDQYLSHPSPHLDKGEPDHPYVRMTLQPVTLEAVSCIQGLLCGAMICLKECTSESSHFPSSAGNVVYLDPKAPLDLSKAAGEYLLIVYARAKALYILQPNDPHTHVLKQLGYVFGDSLASKWHPQLKLT